jgi:hypothetical protein
MTFRVTAWDKYCQNIHRGVPAIDVNPVKCVGNMMTIKTGTDIEFFVDLIVMPN